MTLRPWLTACALVALALGTAGSHAAEPRIGKLVAYELDGYTIYTTRKASQAQRFASALAKFHVALEKLMGEPAKDTHIPTHIVILSAGEWEKYLQPRQNIAGWFHRGAFTNFIVMNGDAEDAEATHLIFHEYTHYFLASQFSGEYPPWLNEGLAEVMGYSKFDKGVAILLIPMDQVIAARNGNWIPFERLIRVDHNSPEYQSHKLADQFYAQSWLTVHYGLLGNRAFGKQMFRYLDQLNRLVPQETAAKTELGDLDAIDQQLRAYSRAKDLHSGGLNLGDVPEPVLPPSKPVSELDALAIVADLMIETQIAPDRIRPVVASLVRREPGSARAATLAARLAFLEQDDAAFNAAVNRAESLLAEGDWEGRRELASVLMQSALTFRPMSKRTAADNEDDLKRAMRWFGEAIKHNNQDVESLWGFGTAAIRLDKDLDLAEQALLTAYQRAPASAQVSVSLVNLKGRQRKPDEMIPYLRDTIRYTTDLDVRRWAAETLIETRKYLAERDRIDAKNRKQREEYEKMQAEYQRKYGKPKNKKANGG